MAERDKRAVGPGLDRRFEIGDPQADPRRGDRCDPGAHGFWIDPGGKADVDLGAAEIRGHIDSGAAGDGADIDAGRGQERMRSQIEREPVQIAQEPGHQLDRIDPTRARDMPDLPLGPGLQPEDRLFDDHHIKPAWLATEEPADLGLKTLIEKPFRAEAIGAFPSGEGQDHITRQGRLPVLERDGGDDKGRKRGFHIRGTAPTHPRPRRTAKGIVDNIPGKGIKGPGQIAGGDRIHMGRKHQSGRRTGPAHPAQNIGPPGQEFIQFRRDARRRQGVMDQLRNRQFPARRIRTRDPDQRLKERDHVNFSGGNGLIWHRLFLTYLNRSASMVIHYSVPVSLYCAKTRILLRHKGIAFEDRPPKGGYGSADYKEIVPSGNLPAIDDGRIVLADSEAIAEYLNERFPEPPMLPGDILDRARVRERGRFHDTRLEPALRLLFPLVGQPAPDATRVSAAAEAIQARLTQLARMLPDDAGATLWLGDCGYVPSFMWIDRLAAHFGFDMTWPGPVSRYHAGLLAHPAVADEHAAYRDNLAPWIAAKARERGGA